MNKRVFVNPATGQIWLEDKIEDEESYLVDPYGIRKDTILPIDMVERCFRFAWRTNENE